MSTVKLQQTSIDLLRHGEVRGEARFRGRTDDPLTELGWRQMFQQCRGQQWQFVVSSPLSRCASFASAWAQEHRTNVAMVPAWEELYFGDWEGLSAEQITEKDPLALQSFYKQPLDFTPPNAESYLHFSARVRRAWDELLIKHAGTRVLVVTHAGVIRVLYSQLLGIPPQHSFQIDVPHACLTRFNCFNDESGRFVQLSFHKPI
ncbi:MAG: alpha-ribazole phosphatase family protein [Methylomonas sp.]|jgi:alpha-ribazole phosphatase/probable phosphoglycerate mutase|uniref:alpha-ribazole phosphatase family protein n=1 Tax=Methylomonas sp. TaxID=418 RepID=UPI0025DCD410|nr:alpha-ribazole phosphatase family protein [Methylomonas sp.]MCK9605980.1 alpha-ribazole phosphatase family protein [Methylomonas sp.]